MFILHDVQFKPLLQRSLTNSYQCARDKERMNSVLGLLTPPFLFPVLEPSAGPRNFSSPLLQGREDKITTGISPPQQRRACREDAL